MHNDLSEEVLNQMLSVELPLRALLRLGQPPQEDAALPARLKVLRARDNVAIGSQGIYGLYVGIARADAQGGDHILELLEAKPEKALTWQEAMDWATAAGGMLPTRKEAALLFANTADHFEKEWYWTCEQHESNAGYAWMQFFDDGYQDCTAQGYEYLARAVRRVPL